MGTQGARFFWTAFFALSGLYGCVSRTNQKMTSDDLIKEMDLIERSFLEQRCASVLIHVQNVKNAGFSQDRFPPVVQAGSLICAARKDPKNKSQLESSISKLKSLNLKYPVLNESWFHSTLADFYSQIGDGKNAEFERNQARDLLLAQKQDMITQSVVPPNVNQQTVEQILTTASSFLNEDAPEKALAVLDAIPTSKQTPASRKMRATAVDAVVSKLRYQVHALFVRSADQPPSEKRKTLLQCESILKGIVQSYPDYSDMASVQYNLKQIQREIAK